MSTAGSGAVPHPKLDVGVRSCAEDAQPPGAAVRQGIGSSGFDRAHHLSDHLV